MAGLGVTEGEAFPSLCGALLVEEEFGHRVQVVASPGARLRNGLDEIERLSGEAVVALTLGLGSNDVLDAAPRQEVLGAMSAIVVAARSRGLPVLVLGLTVPAELHGAEYARGLESAYEATASQLGASVVPSFLREVVGRPELNHRDGLHPNPFGHRRLAERVCPEVLELARAADRNGAHRSERRSP